MFFTDIKPTNKKSKTKPAEIINDKNLINIKIIHIKKI